MRDQINVPSLFPPTQHGRVVYFQHVFVDDKGNVLDPSRNPRISYLIRRSVLETSVTNDTILYTFYHTLWEHVKT